MATETIKATDHKLLVAGEWVETGEWAEVKSPYDGTLVGRVPEGRRGAGRRAARRPRERLRGGRLPPARARRGARPRRRAGRASGRTTWR